MIFSFDTDEKQLFCLHLAPDVSCLFLPEHNASSCSVDMKTKDNTQSGFTKSVCKYIFISCHTNSNKKVNHKNKQFKKQNKHKIKDNNLQNVLCEQIRLVSGRYSACYTSDIRC